LGLVKVNEKICIVDDDEDLAKVLSTILRLKGYIVEWFPDGPDFLIRLQSAESPADSPDLVILDIGLPTEDGYEVTRKIRAGEKSTRLPVIHITGGAPNQKYLSLESGADDFVTKPFSSMDLVAKVTSLLTIRQSQLSSIRKIDTLKNFVDPGVASLVVENDNYEILDIHDSDVAVVFFDLRSFSQFARSASRRKALSILGAYYAVVGNAALRMQGTLGYLAGDGIMVFFNDPSPINNYQLVAATFAARVREELSELVATWKSEGYDLGVGIGIDWGVASIGKIGFAQFSQYTVIGSTVNFAARLCSACLDGEILIAKSALDTLPAGCLQVGNPRTFDIKGFGESVVYNLESLNFEVS
jgi:adenylate cyclase